MAKLEHHPAVMQVKLLLIDHRIVSRGQLGRAIAVLDAIVNEAMGREMSVSAVEARFGEQILQLSVRAHV